MSDDFIEDASESLEKQDHPYAIVVAGLKGCNGCFDQRHYNYDPDDGNPEHTVSNAKILIRALESLIETIREQNDIKDWE